MFSLAYQGSYRIEVVYKVGFAWVHCQIGKVFCFWRKDYASKRGELIERFLIW